jgi:multidrug efflux system membrane fusion protein
MQTRLLTVIVATSLFAVVAAGCERKPQSAFQRPPTPVSVVTAVTKDVPLYLDGIGKSVAIETVSIQPQVSGRITEIHFADGADVKKGDLLLIIDPRPYEAQLHSAEATLAQNKAQLELAKIQFAREVVLLEAKAVSQQEFDQKKNAADVAEAQVQQSQAAVETARLNLDYCFIHSPISGRAGQRLVDVGNVVAANTGSLLLIENLDPVYADFTITENELTAVQRNMKQGSLKVEVRLPDEPDRPRAGALTFVDNTVQEGTGTVKLRATIPNQDHYFWPGRFVRVRLVLGTIQDALLIPAPAPQMSGDGSFVYVVKDDSTAELRPVKLGQRQGKSIVVDEGLKSGEKVVVNGQLGVTPGGKVHVEEQRSVVRSPTKDQEDES